MTFLKSVKLFLIHIPHHPRKHSIADWLLCQAVRLAISSIAENTKAIKDLGYFTIRSKGRELVNVCRSAAQMRKVEGLADPMLRKYIKEVKKGPSWWVLLGHETCFRVRTRLQASEILREIAVTMVMKEKLTGQTKAGKYAK
jgi:hypothetical protein